MSELSLILEGLIAGDPVAAQKLFPLVYDELRRMAAAKLAQERPGQTLQATALVHEAYLRLVGQNGDAVFQGRRHFFGAAAEAMRRILVDRARRRGRERHGGALNRVDLPDVEATQDDEQLLALDALLPRLAAEDPVAGDVVKLKYFGGLDREEIAETLGLSLHEVRQKWAYARAWLRIELEKT